MANEPAKLNTVKVDARRASGTPDFEFTGELKIDHIDPEAFRKFYEGSFTPKKPTVDASWLVALLVKQFGQQSTCGKTLTVPIPDDLSRLDRCDIAVEIFGNLLTVRVK